MKGWGIGPGVMKRVPKHIKGPFVINGKTRHQNERPALSLFWAGFLILCDFRECIITQKFHPICMLCYSQEKTEPSGIILTRPSSLFFAYHNIYGHIFHKSTNESPVSFNINLCKRSALGLTLSCV